MSDKMSKVQYIHLRAHGDSMCNKWVDPEDHSHGKERELVVDAILPRGGATICYLPVNTFDGKKACIGVTVCTTWENYRKISGRGYALGRAMREDKEDDPNPSYDLMTFDEAVEIGMVKIAEVIRNSVDYKRNLIDRWYKEAEKEIEALKEMGESLAVISRRKKEKV